MATAVKGTQAAATAVKGQLHSFVSLETSLPAGATFTRASTETRVIANGGPPVLHAIDVPVFEWVTGQSRRGLAINPAGTDPSADDVCSLPLNIGSSADGGRLELVSCPQFAASARVGQAENDWLLALPLNEVAIVWAGSMAGVPGASEAGWRIEIGPMFARTLRKLVVTRHTAGQRLSFVLHWGGGYRPHIQVDGWARILNDEIGTFASQTQVLLHQYYYPYPTPAWHLEMRSVIGRRMPERLFGVCGDSISSETDEIWPTVISSSWVRTFGARLRASEGGYALAEGVPGREMPDWLADTRLLDSNATDIIFAIGTNDVDHHVGTNLAQMQSDITTLVGQAIAAGKRAHPWTVPPGGYSGAKESLRLAYNAWLVAGGVPLATSVIDSAACLADPDDPSSILAAWHEPLTPNHPNDAGHVVLGTRIADLMGLP